MTYIIWVKSIDQFGEVEWTERISAPTKRSSTLKANKVVRSCGYSGVIEKHKLETSEFWYLNYHKGEK